jgi:hypothetical protein
VILGQCIECDNQFPGKIADLRLYVLINQLWRLFMKLTHLFPFTGRKAGLLGAIFSSLVLGGLAFPIAGIAQNTPAVEEDANVAPAQELEAPAQPMQLSQNLQMPVAYVMPRNAPIAVQIINRTNTEINYEAIGETRDRILTGGDETMLTNLQIPLTVTFERPDGGLIQAEPEVIAPGQIRIYLDEANSLDSDITNMRIDLNGEMFLY